MTTRKRVKACGIGVAVKRPDGVLAVSRGIWASKHSARDAFVASLPKGATWKSCYAKGCRVVVVEFKEIGTISPRGK